MCVPTAEDPFATLIATLKGAPQAVDPHAAFLFVRSPPHVGERGDRHIVPV